MFKKRKKLTQEIIDKILKNEVAIWIWAVVNENPRPFQVVFPGQAVVHNYPGRKSYFTVPNSEDKFYFKDFDYFWFICDKDIPEEKLKA